MILLLACNTVFLSDGGQIAINVHQVHGSDADPVAFVPGTTLCPALECPPEACPDHPNAGVDECYSQSVTGPAHLDDCLHLDAPGAVSWAFDRVPCPFDAYGFTGGPDVATVEVVAPDAVRADVVVLEDSLGDAIPGDGVPFPPDRWTQPDGSPYRLVAGAPFVFRPRLERVADGASVGWNPEDATLSAAGGELVSNEAVAITLEVGQETTGLLSIGEGRWTFVTAIGVDADEAASLAVVTAIRPDDPDLGTSSPLGARAVVHDAAGNLLWGAPIDWSIAGYPLAGDSEPSIPVPGGDYLMLADLCTPPSQQAGVHTTDIIARFSGLKAQSSMTWTATAVEVPEDEWEPNEYCLTPELGCGCDTAGTAAPWPILAAAWLAARRGRRAGAVQKFSA